MTEWCFILSVPDFKTTGFSTTDIVGSDEHLQLDYNEGKKQDTHPNNVLFI